MRADPAVIQPVRKSTPQDTFSPCSLTRYDQNATTAIIQGSSQKTQKVGVGCVLAHTMEVNTGVHSHFSPPELKGRPAIDTWALPRIQGGKRYFPAR